MNRKVTGAGRAAFGASTELSPPPPPCDIPSLRGPEQSPVLPFACRVGSPRSPAGVVFASAEPSGWCPGVALGLLRGSCPGLCCPLPSAFWSSTTRLDAFPWARGPSGSCFFTEPWTVTRSFISPHETDPQRKAPHRNMGTSKNTSKWVRGASRSLRRQRGDDRRKGGRSGDRVLQHRCSDC